MRRLILIGFITAGAAVGLLAGMNGDWGLKVVMMLFGALVGVAIGGALARIGARGASVRRDVTRTIPGMGTASEDLAANYWRDKGHPPFMKPPAAENERRIFDPSLSD